MRGGVFRPEATAPGTGEGIAKISNLLLAGPRVLNISKLAETKGGLAVAAKTPMKTTNVCIFPKKIIYYFIYDTRKFI